MNIIFIIIILALVAMNFWCFYKSRKYLSKVDEKGQESQENYLKGLRYIKISVGISLIICLTGALAVILVKVI